MTDQKIINLFGQKLKVGDYVWHERLMTCRLLKINGEECLVRTSKKYLGTNIYKECQVELSKLTLLDEQGIANIILLGFEIPIEPIATEV